MLLWLKIALKESSFLFRSKQYVSFAWLATRYGSRKRYALTNMTIEGKKFLVPDALSVVWQYYEIFFKQYYHFTTTSKHPRIIDIGSNIGLSIFYFKKYFPGSSILGFEADPIIFKYLTQNLKHAVTGSVEVINKAVWIHNDGIQLSQEGSDGGSVMMESSNSISISSISLVDILSAESTVDMIKMDIEGAEIDVLAHAADQLFKVQHLFVEFHSFAGHKQRLSELLTILEKNGFRYQILDVQNFKKALNGQIDFQCNIFCERL